MSDQLDATPVESIAGVIVKYDKDGTIIDVVGVSNSPEHAYDISQQLQAKEKTDFTYDVITTKVYPEQAI